MEDYLFVELQDDKLIHGELSSHNYNLVIVSLVHSTEHFDAMIYTPEASANIDLHGGCMIQSNNRIL
jgi:hypothetical protein